MSLTTTSIAMRELISAANDVAPTRATVLITGESGSGKKTLAKWLHQHSGAQRLIAVSAAALDFEAWASALLTQSTVVLDDVSALNLENQGRFLSLLDTATARIIAVAKEDLKTAVDQGRVRSDLFYRLNVFPLVMPALRQRREDLPELCSELLREHSSELNRAAPSMSAAALELVGQTHFPGNVRELSNLLNRTLVRSRSEVLQPGDLGLSPVISIDGAALLPPQLPLELDALEKLAIAEALRRVGGNRTHAARLLGIGVRTLRQKLNVTQKLNITLGLAPSSEPKAAGGIS